MASRDEIARTTIRRRCRLACWKTTPSGPPVRHRLHRLLVMLGPVGLASVFAAPVLSAQTTDTGWPREIAGPQATIVVYEPQPDSLVACGATRHAPGGNCLGRTRPRCGGSSAGRAAGQGLSTGSHHDDAQYNDAEPRDFASAQTDESLTSPVRRATVCRSGLWLLASGLWPPQF
jgi:hypothetical protein